MTDLAVLAVGFGVVPLASILLLSFRDWIAAHRPAVWGTAAGIIAFLGLSHAMGFVLAGKPFLFGGESEAATVLFLLMGLGLGGSLGWFVFEGPFPGPEPSRIVWAIAAFLALHSFGDGLVLGRGFVGGVGPILQLDAVNVSATVVHRLVEGAVLLIPTMAVGWRHRSSFLILLLSLSSIPAAYLPGFFFDWRGLVDGSATTQSVSIFLAAMEASLALAVLARGFLAGLITDRSSRWLPFVLIGFIAISVVHFLVE